MAEWFELGMKNYMPIALCGSRRLLCRKSLGWHVHGRWGEKKALHSYSLPTVTSVLHP